MLVDEKIIQDELKAKDQINEQTELEKQQAAEEAKQKEIRHPITLAIGLEGARFAMLTVPSAEILRLAEMTGQIPLNTKAWNRLNSIRDKQLQESEGVVGPLILFVHVLNSA